jgi:hypothetical protein
MDWSVANLILVSLTVVAGILLLGGAGDKRDAKMPLRGWGVGVAAVSILLFVFVENMSRDVGLFDWWTVPIAALAAGQGMICLRARTRK